MTLRLIYGIFGSIIIHVLLVVFAPDVVLPKMSMPEYKKHEVSFISRHLQLPKALIHKPVPQVLRPKHIPKVKRSRMPTKPIFPNPNALSKVKFPKLPSKPIFSDPNSLPKINSPKLPSKPFYLNPNALSKIELPKMPSRPVFFEAKNIPGVKSQVMPIKPSSPAFIPYVQTPEYPSKIKPPKLVYPVRHPKKSSLIKRFSNNKNMKLIDLKSALKKTASKNVKFSYLSIKKKAKQILARKKNKKLHAYLPKIIGKQVGALDVSKVGFDIDKYIDQIQKNLDSKKVVMVDSPLRKEMQKRTRQLIFTPPPPKINSLQTPATVVLKFWVLSDGSVGRILVEKKANAILEVSAINHLKKWKFNNLVKKKLIKEQWGIVAYRFLVD
ncbi:MAG: hypothetical protein VX794_02055 [Nitrospinota bacterium]|nr:hypothetical protein [Nitrospinota bacterium]